MAEATLNGENLVKLSKKMTSKLKGFQKKVDNGLTKVPYIFGTIFEKFKLRKEEKSKAKEKLEKVIKDTKSKNGETKKSTVTKDLSQSVDAKEIIQAIQKLNPNVEISLGDPNLDPDYYESFYCSIPAEQLILPDGFYYNEKNGVTNKHNTKTGEYIGIPVKPMPKKKEIKHVIPFGDRVDAFVKRYVEENQKKKAPSKLAGGHEDVAKKRSADKEETKKIQGKRVADLLNDRAKENTPAQPETVTIETQAKPKPKKNKKDLTDLTIFDTYADYKYAFFWNYYINKKEFDSVQLDAIAKLQAKTADVKFYRTILTESIFNTKRLEQLKEKEIDSIRKAEAEKNAQLDAERDAAIQKAKDDAQSTIDTLQAKLTESRSKNRVLTSKLKVNTEALVSIAEISTTIGGIKAIDEVITKADKKCQGIDDRVERKEKNKDDKEEKSAIESDVDRRMKSINESVYGKKEKTESESVVASTVQDPTQKEEPTTETDSASLVNELASYNDTEIASPSIFDNTISDPKVELETVPLIPSWKLGSVESQMATKTLSDATTAEFNKMVEENNKSHGRTR